MRVRLTDICSPKQWKTISTSQLHATGYPVYGANGVIGYYDKYNHEEPTIMIACRGATCGAINISKPKSYINGNAMSLDKLSENVLLKYLYYLLVNYNFQKVISGSAQPQITKEGLRKVKINVCSLSEQKKIIKTLDSLENLIDKRKQQLEKLVLIVKLKFIEMFGEKVVRRNNWETLPINRVILKPLSGEWGKDDVLGTGVKVLRTTNFTDSGEIAYTDVVTRLIDSKKVSQKALREGDILIEKSGGSDTKPVGRVVFYHENSEKYLFNNFTSCLRCENESLDCNYLFMFLFIKYWEGATKCYENRTTGIHNLKLMDYLTNTMISIPPKELQKQFAEFIKQIDKSKNRIKRSLEKLETLKKALMQEYFG